MFIATVDENGNHIAAVEDSVARPIAFYPSGIHVQLIFSGLKDRDHVATAELTVEVRVANPGVLQVLDPYLEILPGDQLIAVEIKLELGATELISATSRLISPTSSTPFAEVTRC